MSRVIIKLHGEERTESLGGKQPSAALQSSKMDAHQLVGQRSRWPLLLSNHNATSCSCVPNHGIDPSRRWRLNDLEPTAADRR